jgi:hypothetical protein
LLMRKNEPATGHGRYPHVHGFVLSVFLGYALRLRGSIGGEAREFLIGVGERAHAKHRFRAGAHPIRGCTPVDDPRLETVEFYEVSDLRVSVRLDFLRRTSVERFLPSMVVAEQTATAKILTVSQFVVTFSFLPSLGTRSNFSGYPTTYRDLTES